MKKTTITFLTAGLLLITGLKAQTIQEGMNHLYAKRHKSAADVFQKLIATNPNNIEAIYWLGQTYFNMDDNAAARQLYEKALATNGGAPLILVGIGHADLLDNKNNDARQRFEAALTASRTNKGDNPVVQTAIGRAIVDSKTGDFNYAIQVLLAATAKDPKNTETLLQLGNAYRKADPGKGGSDAYTYYMKALAVNPNFAVVSVRLAKLFETQKNWEFVLRYLNEAVAKDPKFSDAYYELFWYYFLRKDFTEANNQLKKYTDSKLPDTDIQDEYLNGQLCYVSKDYDCAITKANNVLNATGNKTKPRVYKLLAYAYFDKGDYQNALTNVRQYFTKEKPEDIIPADMKLRADILGQTGGDSAEVFNAYMQAVNADTVLTSKLDLLKAVAKIFKDKKQRDMEAMVLEKIIEIKPKPSINDYFDLTLAYYFIPNYGKSYESSSVMVDKYPEQVYGYEWKFNSARAIDTVKKDSIAVPAANLLHAFSKQDTVKYRKQYISTSTFLADYYINTAKNKDSALVYFQKWHDNDTANATKVQEYIDTIKKMSTKPPAKGNTPVKTGSSKPAAIIKPKGATTPKTGSIKPPAKKTTTTKAKIKTTSTTKNSVAKVS
jgi:tetratricopeptide (TPR) repeat protein